MQFGTQKRRHDTSEHHLSLALWTGRTLDCSERDHGRQELWLCHSTSFEQGASATLLLTDHTHRVAPIRTGNMSLRSSANCSVLLIFRNGLSPFFCFPHHFIGQPSFIHDRKCLAASGHFNPRNLFTKKDRAAFAGGPSQGRKRPRGLRKRRAFPVLVFDIQQNPAVHVLNL